MKKYNFLDEPPDDPFESDGAPTGRLSPAARRLLVIGLVGVALAGGLYVYTTYFGESPPSPARPLGLRGGQGDRPTPPVPAPAKPTEVRQEPFRPTPVREEAVTSSQVASKPVTAPAPPQTAKQEAIPPTPKTLQAKPPSAPSQAQKPTPPAQPREKPAMASGVDVEKPRPQAPAKAEKPAPTVVAKATQPQITSEGQYAVQVASLVREKNVLSLKKQLEELGYSPDIRKITIPITHHRVYAGEFGSREEADRTARKLNVDGFPSTVVTLKGGMFAPEVGSFLRLNLAIDLAHDLQKKNYAGKIVSRPTPTPVHQIRVGTFASRSEARKTLEALKGKGFQPLIVKR